MNKRTSILKILTLVFASLIIIIALGRYKIIQRYFTQPRETTIPTNYPNIESSPIPGKSDNFGVNTGIGVNEPIIYNALEYAAGAKIGWVRMLCDWHAVEPKDNNWNESNFKVCDLFVDKANSLGLNVDMQLTTATSWCQAGGGESGNRLIKRPKCTPKQWEDYVYHIVSRYSKKGVQYFEMGNEPDLVPEWRDYPERYAALLALSYQTAKKVNPSSKVLIGGLAAGGGQNANQKFLDEIINDSKYPALENFDVFSYHTYATIDGITTLLNLIKQKIGNKPIWITEVGFPSDTKTQQETRARYNYPPGEDGQADYLKDVLPHILNLGVEKVFWYTLVDVPRDDTKFCSYGLLYIPGKQCLGKSAQGTTGQLVPKKSYTAYKELSPPR